MPLGERGSVRGRRLSAGTENGSPARDSREPCEGADDDTPSQAAEDRSGDGRRRAVVDVVEASLTHRAIADNSGSTRSVRRDDSTTTAGSNLPPMLASLP